MIATAAAFALEAVLAYVAERADIIVPLANGEPRTLIDTFDAHAHELTRVRVHQMHALYGHPYLHNAYGDHLVTSRTSCRL